MSDFNLHEQELEFLQKQGFPINPLNKKAKDLKEIWEIKEDLESKKETLSYPIDGLVIKLNDNNLVEKLGIVGKTRRAWSAIKFKADEVTTKILGVSWQVGRSGKVTPVAELEPVELVGTIVKRATLHNYKEFIEKDLQPGDTLVIHKAGDIIPEVLNVLVNLRNEKLEWENKPKNFKSPQNCPSCQTELGLSQTGVDLVCPNYDHCNAQVLGRLSYFTGRNVANIRGLSDKILQKFIDLYEVKDIPDLYDLPYEEISELTGFGAKSAKNIYESVEKSKQISDYRFLAGLAIDGLGPEVSKLIIEKMEQKNLLKED